MPTTKPVSNPPIWNTGFKIGPKKAFQAKEVWEIRFHLQNRGLVRDRALFDLAIDSKLRGCDLVKIRIGDIAAGGEIRRRATVIQQKTGRPVQFEITETARESLSAWLQVRGGTLEDFAFPEQADALPTHWHAAVRSAGQRVGRGDRPAARGVRHPLPAPDEGLADLQENRQPPCRSDSVGPYQD